MNTPGIALKSEREKQQRSLEEIAKKLKIKIEYLKAIEDDNYLLLPAEVYTKAYMRLYAEALNIKSDELLSLYKDQSTVSEPAEPVFEEKKKEYNYRPFIVAVAFLMIASLAFYFIKSETQETVQKITKEIVTPPINKVEEEVEKMFVEFIAMELTWVSVSIDDAKPEEWLLRRGDSIKLNASVRFVVKIGNAGGTKLLFNGKDIGELGPHGKVVDIVLP